MPGSRKLLARVAESDQRLDGRIDQLARELDERIQRLEWAPRLARMGRELAAAATLAQQGCRAAHAIEHALRAIGAAPLPRGKAGGLARARTAWRYDDGTFASDSLKEEASRAEYERYARGGRQRAASAHRYEDGTFAPNEPSESRASNE